MAEFFQDGPELKNTYENDRILRSFLKRRLPKEVFTEIEPGLRKLGERAATDIYAMGQDAEAHEPEHVPYDGWGRRIDEVRVAQGWKDLDRVGAEEGIVATAYERKHGALSRIHQFARLYLYHPSSAIYSCPLAMTDGAAHCIEIYGDEYLKGEPYRRLTSRNPDEFWTSGQWMTEREGGSDVGLSSTVARLENGEYRLYGTKFFTSAVTSQIAMTLARIEGAPQGGRGLSMFYIEQRDKDGKLNNIRVNRLKDKLGTRALPTAELELCGTPARLVGEPGDGTKKISSLFNITRMWNSVCAVAGLQRGLVLARDWAPRRFAFGKMLSEQPLHLEMLAALEVDVEASFHLTFHLAELLGKDETGTATAEETAILRMLTPIAKLFTAKITIAGASEIVESFGGTGYMEDSGIPVLLRDAQTLSIWEGTTNVLSLDTLRAIEKEGAYGPFMTDLRARLDGIKHPDLAASAAKVRAAAEKIDAYLPQAMGEGLDYIQAGARAFAFSLARTYAAALLLEHAQWSAQEEKDTRSVFAAQRWCSQDLAPLAHADAAHRAATRALALGQVAEGA